MRILAIDTSTELCSVALLDNKEVYSVYEYYPREHAQLILPMIQNILSDRCIELQQLDAIAVNRGPGSFTGLRIGISVAKGIGLGINLSIIGISTLAILAEKAWKMFGAQRVLVAIDAHMGELYWAEYQRVKQSCWNGENTERVLNPQEIKSHIAKLSGHWCIVGSGWKIYNDLFDGVFNIIPVNCGIPIAQDMLPLAIAALKEGNVVSADCIKPCYLRKKLIWKKLPGRV
ncbi:MAG: tRNA (adenosine(37)-N6)-threonylcarbamoyltransferase complex dimerization subunit type 1 TsaB [Candidatus Dasytiphilus stammeri]